ncbi:uncharacterized protein K452DRAFT_289072 [Aplosporella prunicola CBS 121167]|uniref:Major facilitator superfamily (MFS) profile domain-containing protein n=1 Tax=Aplosporella prunicola CBS 121167 TaxID=1176127 RepID=A0A6A6B8Q5_9PEZI|nr:uncharacterized protein K452DRAFT_289072 [Aplosporella prunicola CBS 121167]KAF2140326.1 hypothetical protein K452DRAFT_289072 [Aplosporella prunicola CBS 121167]
MRLEAETSIAKAPFTASSIDPRKQRNDVGPISKYNTDSEVGEVEEVDPKKERKLVWKLDFSVMILIFLMYFFNSIDRSNLGNAKTDGMEDDLDFKGNQYSVLVMVFSVTFCGLCLPANLVTRKYQPKWFLIAFMVSWGTMAMICAACKNFAQMLAVRLLLGVAEAGFAPCSMFYMSTFYTRGELATRFAIWYTATVISGAFSGMISYGLFQLGGPLHGWQYLFIVEGGLTVLVATFAALILPEDPWTCRWLTEEEKAMCITRGKRDSSSIVGSAWNFREGMQPFKSWQIYAWAVIGLCYGTSGNAVGSFLPQIVQMMGFSTLKTNLYTVAPNLVGAVILFMIARSSDHFRERSGHLILSLLITFVGWIILICVNPTEHIALSYFACFLLCGGAMTPTVLFHSWHASNMHTENGRIYVMSFLTGAANSGGIVSSLVFRNQDAPRYILFLVTSACFEGMGMVLILFLRCWMLWDNRRRDRLMGVKTVSKDVRLSDLSGGTNDVRWRWFL